MLFGLIRKSSGLIRIKKFYFFFLVFCFLFVPATISAQQDNFSAGTHEKALSAPDKNKQKFDQQTFAGLINSGGCALAGCNAPGLKMGAISVTNEMIAWLYINQPASGLAYVRDVINQFNPVQPVYAQTGTGFTQLSPLLSVWRAFRNFAYVIFAIVFVLIGLAVMFRMKIDPRTAITIQSAIPRIVVALLLITFSYAIAGFVIDLIYVSIALVALIFGQAGIAGLDTATLQSQYVNGTFLQAAGNLFSAAFINLRGAIAGAGGIAIGALIGGALGALTPVGFSALAGAGLGAALVAFAMLAIVVVLLFRLFLELLRAYIGILLSVVFGPLQIAIGVAPGAPGFGSWLKGLVANALVFPAVVFVLILGHVFIRALEGDLWMPPLLVGGTGLLRASMPLILGVGVLLVVNQVPQVIRNMFGIRGLGFAVGQALGPAAFGGRAAYLGTSERLIQFLETTAPGGALGASWQAGLARIGRRMTGLRR